MSKLRRVTGYTVYYTSSEFGKSVTPRTWKNKAKAKNSRFFKKCKKLGFKPRVKKVTRNTSLRVY